MKKKILILVWLIVSSPFVTLWTLIGWWDPQLTPPSNGGNNNWQTPGNISGTPSNTPVNPNSPAQSANPCSSYKADDKLYATCVGCVQRNGQDSAQGPKCTAQFSCETLFVDAATARTCNFKRCEVQRWIGADYCTCKYGAGWNGLNVWIPLNTTMPFIGRCLKKSDWSTSDTAALDAFPTIVWVASRILVTVIMLVSFIMIIVGWVQRASGDAKAWKAKITKVAIWFALLGMMGAILRLINPNFFK